jgi:hypothetical protein
MTTLCFSLSLRLFGASAHQAGEGCQDLNPSSVASALLSMIAKIKAGEGILGFLVRCLIVSI